MVFRLQLPLAETRELVGSFWRLVGAGGGNFRVDPSERSTTMRCYLDRASGFLTFGEQPIR
jgi:hypothetical protein